MKEMTFEEMEKVAGGGWCFAAGAVTAIAIATAPIGLLMYGPAAVGLIAACIR